MHYIQAHILDKLIHAQSLRNRDMRPPNVESNLYQYHLLQLCRLGYVKKSDLGYSLTGQGLAYADRHSTSLKKTRPQPKLITTLFLTNSKGQILLIPRSRQPFMGMYNLPSGKIHLDESVNTSIAREVEEKITSGMSIKSTQHIGISHMTIKQSDYVISDYFALLISVNLGHFDAPTGAIYVDPKGSKSIIQLMPSVAELLTAFTAKQSFSEKTINIDDNQLTVQ